jgi:hypothetical protein
MNRPTLARLRSRPGLFAALGAMLWLGAGCATAPRIENPAAWRPDFKPVNYTGVVRLPDTLKRVVVLPSAGEPGVPVETLRALDPEFVADLEQQARFEVVTVRPETLFRDFGQPRFLSTEPLPADLLATLARQYGADGVLFIDVTAFSPYGDLTLGLRAKLVSVPGGTILWAFDQVYRTGNPAVADSARWFDQKRHPAIGQGDLSSTVLQSPVRFGDYAAATTFATLPPR